jgi:hypothetical protein
MPDYDSVPCPWCETPARFPCLDLDPGCFHIARVIAWYRVNDERPAAGEGDGAFGGGD